MKRPDTKRPSKRTGNVRKDLTQNQLAWIASVALAYNEAERLVDLILITSIFLGDISSDVIGRINGVENKVDIAKLAMREIKCPGSMLPAIGDSLGEGGFMLLKKYRDRIIHASVVDAAAAIARSPAHRGKFEEVLLTVKGLKALYRRLVLVRQELIRITRIASVLSHQKYLDPVDTVIRMTSGPNVHEQERKMKNAKEIREHFAQLRRHQKARLSLPPLPQFPTEAQLRLADVLALRERQAAIPGPRVRHFQTLRDGPSIPEDRFVDWTE
jgi:hypothetical protein